MGLALPSGPRREEVGAAALLLLSFREKNLIGVLVIFSNGCAISVGSTRAVEYSDYLCSTMSIGQQCHKVLAAYHSCKSGFRIPPPSKRLIVEASVLYSSR